MTLVDLAIKLAMYQTRVTPRCRFLAFGLLGIPLACRIVFANDLLGIVDACKTTGRGVDPLIKTIGGDAETWAGEQHNKRQGEEILHVRLIPLG